MTKQTRCHTVKGGLAGECGAHVGGLGRVPTRHRAVHAPRTVSVDMAHIQARGDGGAEGLATRKRQEGWLSVARTVTDAQSLTRYANPTLNSMYELIHSIHLI